MRELLVLLCEELFKISTTPVSMLSLLCFALGIVVVLARAARAATSAFLAGSRSAPAGVS